MSDTARRVRRIVEQVVLYGVIGYFVWRSFSGGLARTDFLHLRFSLPYLLASWVAIAGYYMIYVGGVNVTLRLLGAPSTFRKAYSLNFRTNIGKYLPGMIWPAVGRVSMAPGMGLPRRSIAPAMLLETGFSVAGALLVFFVSLALGESIPAGTHPWQWAALAALLVVGLLPPVWRRVLALGFRVAHVDAAVPEVGFGATAAVVGYFAVSWIVAGIAFRLYTLALLPNAPGGLQLYIGAYAVAVATGLVVLFAPGGLGVREGVIALLLAPAVGPAAATVVAFSARVWSTIMELVLTALAFVIPVVREGQVPEGDE